MAAELFCKNCGSKLDPGARFCSNCGSPVLSQAPYVSESPQTAPKRSMTTSPRQQTISHPPVRSDRHAIISRKQKSPGVAAFLSFLWTGLGQIYVGELGRGIMFMVIAFFLLWTVFIGIGLILIPVWWIYGIFDANKLANQHNEDLMNLA